MLCIWLDMESTFLNEMLFYVFLSEGKHLLMFNIQLCLTFKRVSVTLMFPLCSAIVTIVQKSRVYCYGYYSYKTLSLY